MTKREGYPTRIIKEIYHTVHSISKHSLIVFLVKGISMKPHCQTVGSMKENRSLELKCPHNKTIFIIWVSNRAHRGRSICQVLHLAITGLSGDSKSSPYAAADAADTAAADANAATDETGAVVALMLVLDANTLSVCSCQGLTPMDVV